jgi:hypothetical protein
MASSISAMTVENRLLWVNFSENLLHQKFNTCGATMNALILINRSTRPQKSDKDYILCDLNHFWDRRSYLDRLYAILRTEVAMFFIHSLIRTSWKFVGRSAVGRRQTR